MRDYVSGWVWLLLSLAMVGVLGVAVVSIPAQFRGSSGPSGGAGQPGPQAVATPGSERTAKDDASADGSVTRHAP